MPSPAGRSQRLLPDGTPLHNRLLAALPAVDYVRIQKHLHMHTGVQILQGIACNALHGVKQRCCRWLLQTEDRVGASDFHLKQDFLAIMLGVQRPTVTLVMGTLQDDGIIATKYGRIRVLQREMLEQAACECYQVIGAHFERLGL